MSKRVGIVTLHGYFNYGNRLQNYALLYTLEKIGVRATTTVVKHTDEIDTSLNKKNNSFRKRIKRHYKTSPDKIWKMIKHKINWNQKKEMAIRNKNREKKFREYSDKYLNEKKYYLNKEEDFINLQKYDFFVTGSDQVWNPVEYKDLPIYFLTFIKKSKRVAYAPSISRKKLPSNYKEEYKDWFEGMEYISVRENAGAYIIKDLTDLDVSVLVDPTMLLSKDEWLSVSKQAPNLPDSPYLLTYFLGGPTDETRRELEELAKEKNMKIINLGDISEKETYETGPSEFLDYINNASAFFTDSFHGIVYSIIFETPFIAYKRIGGEFMYSRIETILNKFNFKHREINGFNEDIFSMDFSRKHLILEKEYEKSISYLKDALKIEG